MFAMAGDEDRTLLERACTLDEENLGKLRPYTWTSEERTFRGGKLSRSQTFEINLVSGSLYWRMTKRNGEPLRGAEAEAERQRLKRHLELARSSGYRNSDVIWREERRALELIPLGQTHRVAGHEEVNGHRCVLIETRPRGGGERTMYQRMKAGIAYRIWAHETEHHWVKAELEIRRPVRWLLHQLSLGRITYPYSNNIVNEADHRSGTKVEFQLMRLPEGAWTLDRYVTTATDFRNELRYFDYRKFSADSQLMTETP